MRRAQCIFVILAILALPLSLLARALNTTDCCDKMCCLPHHHQHSAAIPAPDPSVAHCRENAASHSTQCDLTCANALPDYGLTALMLPAFPLAAASISTPASMRSTIFCSAALASLGFLDLPLQPPRA